MTEDHVVVSLVLLEVLAVLNEPFLLVSEVAVPGGTGSDAALA